MPGVARYIAEQSFGGQCPHKAAKPHGQAGSLLLGEGAKNAFLAVSPRTQEPGGYRASLGSELQPDITLIRRVAPAPDPALALKADGQPAYRALLQPKEAGQFALRDAARGKQLEQRSGLGRRHDRAWRCGRGLGLTGRTEQPTKQLLQLGK